MKFTRRKMLWFILAPLAIVIVAIIICYSIVSINANGLTYDNVTDIKHNNIGLLLGTSPQTPDNEPNYYYINRIIATAELYNAGKIDTVIASGGDYSSQPGRYNELVAMHDSLVAHGIPDSVIILDYDGTRTLNSIIKAKEVYGCDKITLISQKYHNERAIFLAKQNGIEAIGYNAAPSHIVTKRIKNESRELLARVKLFIDTLIGTKPHFDTPKNDA